MNTTPQPCSFRAQVMVLVFENYCHGEESQTVKTFILSTPTTKGGASAALVDMDLENQTPHGSITVSVRSADDLGKPSRVRVKDYASDEATRNDMTVITGKEGGSSVAVVSKPYHYASILGFDVSCEKALQMLQVAPGTALGQVRVETTSNADVR